MKKIGMCFGTRPELIKLFPLAEALRSDNFEVTVMFTGQHPDLVKPLAKKLNFKIDVELSQFAHGASISNQISKYVEFASKEIMDRQIDCMIVQGDTVSTFSGALAAFSSSIELHHLEAGLRSQNLKSPFPEEGFRRAITQIATLHFAPTDAARQNLLNEGVNKSDIHVVGNTGIDALHKALNMLTNEDNIFSPEEKRRVKNFALVTLHRRENWHAMETGSLGALKKIAQENLEFNFVYVHHANPKLQEKALSVLGNSPNVIFSQPLDYLKFCYLLSGAKFIFTDSGGLQEEGPSLGIKTLVARDTTERPEAIGSGLLEICGSDFEGLVTSLRNAINSGSENLPKFLGYGDGNSSMKIKAILENRWVN
jgi:UDP-N-acetylglucosamine 2-epimerase (non-hydrolysing)